MSLSSTACVPTTNGTRYIQQLSKHWSHSLKVDQAADRARIVFPKDARGASWPGDATVTLIAGSDAIHCRIDATAPGQLEGLKTALSQHLDRFAFREAPLAFPWEDL